MEDKIEIIQNAIRAVLFALWTLAVYQGKDSDDFGGLAAALVVFSVIVGIAGAITLICAGW